MSGCGDDFHRSGEEAVSQSAGVCSYVSVPFPRGKRLKQFVSQVDGVCSYTTSSPRTSNLAIICRVQWWEWTSHNTLCCFHHLGQVLSLLCSAAPVPHCCTQTEDAFYCGSIEVCKELRRESSPFNPPKEEEPLLGPLHQLLCVHVDQVMSDVM